MVLLGVVFQRIKNIVDSPVKQSTDIKLPAPIYYGLALALGFALNTFWDIGVLPTPWGLVVGIALIMNSILITLPVLLLFKKQRTTFDSRRVPTSLIMEGPFRYSRNPSYVALTLLYLGLAIVINSFWLILLLLPVLIMVDRKIICSEEKYLTQKFGDDYRQYQSSVRRWL